MRIDQLHLINFRNFEDYKLRFGKKTTVLIGKNGSGKTNLIKSLVYAVSFPFAKNRVDGEQAIAISSKDLKVASIDSAKVPDARFDQNMNDYIYPLSIQAKACFDDEDTSWEMLKESKGGGLKPTLYKSAFEAFHRHYFKGDRPLPVLAFFADSYPHIRLDIRNYSRTILKSTGKLPLNFGYYMWDRESNCMALWKERYIKIFTSLYQNTEILKELSQLQRLRNQLAHFPSSQTDKLSEAEKFRIKSSQRTGAMDKGNLDANIKHVEASLAKLIEEQERKIEFREIKFVNERIVRFSAPLREDLDFINDEFSIEAIEVTGTTKLGQSIQFNFRDGRKIHLDHLPQGYKRLISITFDIAYRSFILNEDKEPHGIVFVDELELHLHPTLQQEVLERFRKTFPEIQFIYSTHSPLIISNFKSGNEDDKLIKLIHDGLQFSHEEVPNIYGVDYNVSLEKVMGSVTRPSAIDTLMDSYVILKLRNKEDAAQKIWDELFSIVGEDNEKVKEELIEKLEANR